MEAGKLGCDMQASREMQGFLLECRSACYDRRKHCESCYELHDLGARSFGVMQCSQEASQESIYNWLDDHPRTSTTSCIYLLASLTTKGWFITYIIHPII